MEKLKKAEDGFNERRSGVVFNIQSTIVFTTRAVTVGKVLLHDFTGIVKTVTHHVGVGEKEKLWNPPSFFLFFPE